jgi:pimeloyl-ACP methyl ester carboxylesterase
MVALFGGCADRLMLYPSSEPIDLAGATRLEVPVAGRTPIEAFILQVNVPAGQEPEAFLLVLDGNGGRGELAVAWGRAAAGNRAVEVWSPNYPGYGQSPGKATLGGVAAAAVATYDAMAARAGGRPILVWGASMGSAAALHVAVSRPVAGLILTNPPPLRQLVMGRYGWWNLWLAATPVAMGIPRELDSLANAGQCRAPALFTSAGADGIVPADFQQRVIDAYAGPKHVLRLEQAGHNDPINVADPAGWRAGIDWLWQRVPTAKK